MLGKIEGRRRWGRQAIRWLDASLTQWTWAWASSRSRCHKVIRHDWVTELSWEVLPWYQIGCKFWELLAYTSFCEWSECVCVLVMLGRTTLELRSSYYLFQLKHGMHSVSSVAQLRPHGLQHTRPPCPSPAPRVYSNSCPLSQWCHPTISSSVIPFSRLQSFPVSGSFPMSWFFASGGQSIGASALVLPKNIQGWFPLGLIGLISWQSKGLSGVHLLEDTFDFNPAFIVLWFIFS